MLETVLLQSSSAEMLSSKKDSAEKNMSQQYILMMKILRGVNRSTESRVREIVIPCS